MKKILGTSKNATPIKKLNLRWHSFDEVFNIASRNKEFQRAYNEELQRLSLAKQIRALRTIQKLTQKVVAQRAGMPQSVIARIESGQSGISLDTLGRVAHAFGKHIQLA
jgi:DNA-binding XRE family transcriptional regulator